MKTMVRIKQGSSSEMPPSEAVISMAATLKPNSGMMTRICMRLGTRSSCGPSTSASIAENAIAMRIARHRFTRVCRRFSSKFLRLNSASSSPSKVSHGNPARSCRACGELGRSSVDNPGAVLIRVTVPALRHPLNDLGRFLKRKSAERTRLIMSKHRSVGQVMCKISVEIGVVRGFYAALRVERVARFGGKLAEPAFVRRIQAQKVVLVKVRHPQRQLKKAFPRLAHFGEQARRGSPFHIVDFRPLLLERRGVGAREFAVIEHLAQSLHGIEKFPRPIGHGETSPFTAQA